MCAPTEKEKEKNASKDANAATTSSVTTQEPLKECDEWIESFDLNGFSQEIRALGKKLQDEQGPDDVQHLQKMVLWSNICAWTGLLTMGLSVNVLAVFALSTWTCTRWTMIAHHTCHGGYDKVDTTGRWNRFRFAIGSNWRRVCDWLDWMMPEAWNIEHNNRHHYNLSETEDPDLVEMNMETLREQKAPLFVKYLMVAGLAMTWKWFYYAPNTYKELKLAALRKAGKPIPAGVKPEDSVTLTQLVLGQVPFYSLSEFLIVVLGPYFIIRFILLPLPLLFLGRHLGMGATMYQNALINLILAEILTNVHSFIIVAPNHAGNDMYRFRDGCRPFSGSFYLRQVIASVDFDMGNDITDFMHGWLNYQIEHHLWPNLSMLSYQKSAPAVREICAKYGVPYVKENVFVRVHKLTKIMVGTESMRWFPEEYERKHLQLDAAVQEQKKE
jgi:fatty acid desaturase